MDNGVTNTTKSQLAADVEQSLSAVFESKMVVIQKPEETTEITMLPGKDVQLLTVDTIKPNTVTLTSSSANREELPEEGTSDLRQDCGVEEATLCFSADNREKEPMLPKPADQDTDSLAPTTSTTEETMTDDLYGEEDPPQEQQQQEETVGESQGSDGDEPNDSLDTLTKQEVVEELGRNKPNGMEPLKMIKKGAVAAVGGTMVGVGLVMIPLPTPFGAVIASSGLAVLGTEFDAAREMNETLVKKTRENIESARDHVIRSIESMESSSEDEDDESDDTETSSDDESPEWLHMNPTERKRQLEQSKEKHRRETQTKWDETSDYITRSTGNFLTKTVLPFLKRTRGPNSPSNEEGQTASLADSLVDDEASMKSGGNATDSKSEDVIEDSVLLVRSDDSIADTSVVNTSTSETAEEVMVVAPIEAEGADPGLSGAVPVLDSI